MDYNLIIGIAIGIIGFIFVIYLIKRISKSFKINPLLGLVGIYLLFQFSSLEGSQYLPESWSSKGIDTPYQIEGTLGFFLNLDQPKMSLIEVAWAVFFIFLILQFIGVFLFNKSFWGGSRSR